MEMFPVIPSLPLRGCPCWVVVLGAVTHLTLEDFFPMAANMIRPTVEGSLISVVRAVLACNKYANHPTIWHACRLQRTNLAIAPAACGQDVG